MFTGLVEELGSVTAMHRTGAGVRLAVHAPLVSTDVAPGDSVCVNGVCLTVVDVDGEGLAAEVVAETLGRSTLGGLRVGDPVNLERAATLATRLGGHLVQGHVDATAPVRCLEQATLTVGLPQPLARYVVEKGSITVDGVSLTVAGLGATEFSVALIPTTLAATTLGGRRAGQLVNLEVDVVAKYVERLLQAGGRDGR